MSFRYRTKEDDLRVLHFQLPKALMYEEKYKDMSANAKILFSMMVDRSSLSMVNNWYDKNGYAFITCEIDEVEVFLNVARATATKVIKELIDKNLIQKGKGVDTGVENFENNNVNVYYVGFVDATDNTLKAHITTYQTNVNALKKKRKEESEIRKQKLKAKKELGSFKNCTMLENTSVEPCENLNPSNCNDSTKIELGLVQNLTVSNTDLSNTDLKSVVVLDKCEDNENIFHKIQKDKTKNTSAKILDLMRLMYMDRRTIDIVTKFIDAKILITDKQINMLTHMDYEIVLKAINETIARAGKKFSYFYKVYSALEAKDIEKFADEVFIPKFPIQKIK